MGRLTRCVSCDDDDALLRKKLKTSCSYHLQGAVCREEAPAWTLRSCGAHPQVHANTPLLSCRRSWQQQQQQRSDCCDGGGGRGWGRQASPWFPHILQSDPPEPETKPSVSQSVLTYPTHIKKYNKKLFCRSFKTSQDDDAKLIMSCHPVTFSSPHGEHDVFQESTKLSYGWSKMIFHGCGNKFSPHCDDDDDDEWRKKEGS